jgi:hypothetical protein
MFDVLTQHIIRRQNCCFKYSPLVDAGRSSRNPEILPGLIQKTGAIKSRKILCKRSELQIKVVLLHSDTLFSEHAYSPENTIPDLPMENEPGVMGMGIHVLVACGIYCT